MPRFDPLGWLERIATGGAEQRADADAAEADALIRRSFDLSRWFGGIGNATEAARAAAESPEADARVRAAVDSLPVTLFEFDANGIYTCVAGRYVGLFGVSAAQIVGRSVFDFPRFVPGKNMMVRRALAGHVVSFAGIWPPGRFMIRLQPRLDASGKVGSVVGLGYEIAKPAAADQQIEQLLEALRQSEARFRAMCESAPLGIFVSNSQFELGYVNPGLCALLGREPGELLGRHWQAAVHAEDRERLQTKREAGEAGPQAYDGVLRFVRKDGALVWASLRIAEMRDGGDVLGYVGTVTDITQERQLQARLLVSERLASVGTLAAGVAHEINNPLGAIVTNLEWVAARLARVAEAQPVDLPQAVALLAELRRTVRPVAEAREAAERVRSIVRDLKLFSRAEEDRQGPSDLTVVLDSAARMAWNEVRHRARFVRDYGELPAVRGSDARLGQVFLNLFVNGAQAIPEGRADQNEVRVSARVAAPDHVVVEVRDTGVGIPADIAGRVFDPFFTTKPRGVGTGLGLAICHRIVSGIGGRIDVESEPGRGSTFRVTLARAEAVQERRAPISAPPPTSEAGGRVLVIDDDPAMGNALGLLLGEDHEVEVFTSARSALARLQDGERYDAIVCDVMMPEMSGVDFHAELTIVQPELAATVIFLTGGAFTLRAREFLDRVQNPRLEKPFDSERLRALVNRQVARTRDRLVEAAAARDLTMPELG